MISTSHCINQLYPLINQSKVTIGHKKAPSTLIDDCINKFRQHELERKHLRLLNDQRGSTESAPIEFIMGDDGDPLSSTTHSEGLEDPEGLEVDEVTNRGGSGGKDFSQ